MNATDLDARATTDRRVYRLAAAVACLPVVVAVIRAGVRGWIPAQDAAPTVARALVALGSSPTLVGMYTDASNWIEVPLYFPGPWQLYWLWLPTRILGVTWGPLVAMGSLTVLWILLTGWFVKRRLGHRVAIGALTLFALLNWTLSSALLVSPVPMVMVLPAFAAFCFGAWALAAGDEGVLPLVAVVANFAVLDHLVLTFLVPFLAVAAVVIWVAGLVVARRRDPSVWPDLRRRSVRAVAIAAVVTVAMWSPPLIQQITGSSGNLGNLWSAAGSAPATPLGLGTVLHRWLGLFTAPDFWLRRSRVDASLLGVDAPHSLAAVVVTAILLGLVAGGVAVSAYRRRDRPAMAAVLMAVIGFVGVTVNMRLATTSAASRLAYVQSSWVMAMFVTFALGFGLVRALRGRIRRAVLPASLVVLVVAAASTVGSANLTTGVSVASDGTVQISREIDRQLVPALRGKGTVAMEEVDLFTYPYFAAAALALEQADVPVCVDRIRQFSGSAIPACEGRGADVVIRFVTTDPLAEPAPGWRRIAAWNGLSDREEAEFLRLSRQIADAFVDRDPGGVPILTPELTGLLGIPGASETRMDSPAVLAWAGSSIAADLGVDHATVGTLAFAQGVPLHTRTGRAFLVSVIESSDDLLRAHAEPPHTGMFDVPVSRAELVRWAELADRWDAVHVEARDGR